MAQSFIGGHRRALFKTNMGISNPSVIDWFRRFLFKTNYVLQLAQSFALGFIVNICLQIVRMRTAQVKVLGVKRC